MIIFSEYNECESLPCQNGGICTDNVNKFTCSCSSGFNGVICDSG